MISQSILKKILEDSKKKINNTIYFKNKGFSNKTIRKFNLGFLPNGLLKYKLEIQEDEEILKYYKYLIPQYSENGKIECLLLRKSLEKTMLPFELNKTYELNYSKNKIWNCKYLFNLKNNPIVFITETWTDALSLEEIGYQAIAFNGIKNIFHFWKILKNIQDKDIGYFISICDNDYYGNKANIDIQNILKNLNCKVKIFNKFPDNIKDCNEWLLYNKSNFKKSIKEYLYNNLKKGYIWD